MVGEKQVDESEYESPRNVIWKATRMFEAPEPKNTKSDAAIVDSHGPTPTRQHHDTEECGADQM